MKFAGLVFAIVVMAHGAEAGFIDGERLNKYCQGALQLDRNPSDHSPDAMGYLISAANCESYVVGVIDAAISSKDPKQRLCLPANATQGTVTELIAKFLDEHPESRQFTADSIVIGRLQVAYPCK